MQRVATSRNRPCNPAHRRSLRPRWTACAGLLAAASLGSSPLAGCRRDTELPVVDLSERVPVARTAAKSAGQPHLRVAVAAMLAPEATRPQYERLVDVIGRRVDRRIDLVQRQTYKEVSELLARGELDVAFVCSGPFIRDHAAFGLELLVVPLAYGKTVYHSYLLAHRDSGIETLDGLRGKTFAFVDRLSNTGYVAPRFMMHQRGLTPDTYFGDTFFTQSHDTAVRAVALGQADGAAVDSLVWEFMNARSQQITGQTRIIEMSPPFGIPPVVVHPSVDPALKEALRAAFLTLHDNTEAAEAMGAIHIERFVRGRLSDYAVVRQMYDWQKTQEPKS